MLTVWGRRTSSNVQVVMWAIGELGLTYERHDVGHRYGGNDTPEFLAMNPNGLVPVVRDGDGPPLFESCAILRYLAGRYGEPPFWPADPAERAPIDTWAEWAKLNVLANFAGPIFWRVARTAPKDRDTAAIATAVETLARFLRMAEDRLARHAFLVGESLTEADIVFGSMLFRYHDLPIDRPDLPALKAYYERLTARPAYREHVMVNYDELKVG
ncbi:glutathione S-transferase family protein [Aurantimonas sp. MSK8Z-1]|uniref:glutathione S-transferase family protein n=1 Tax=Mangrovibrevibacter kandeliae TaxID=2968473 RepID=UPI0021188F00|nr:glutathione S-transferase family protein [Aurantimonas sp. MSK8Z-1]MCW4116571.1 glutathione S-transferase family protein [Aurantimonas sp. MSK8Z-1]